ncbi:hypothetical protein ABZ930_08400 [Streptomyces sp. NPDC046716]|uniref:hypothetical protein n=1 Tax=Streptomyces sp. NPDC046716 TaxID=3157093 RepID=UPI0033C1BF0E
MQQNRRRDRRPVRRVGPVREPSPAVPVPQGADVVLVGFFSGKQRDFGALMDAAAEELARRGARVVGRIVQRRGVSAGGAARMTLPYSSRTLLSYGKVRETAALCARTRAEAAVFLCSLTDRQRRVLTRMLGVPAVSLHTDSDEAA